MSFFVSHVGSIAGVVILCYCFPTIEHSDNVSSVFVIRRFYARCLLAFHPTPNLDARGSLFFWPLPFSLLGMGGPVRIIKLQPPYIHFKVMIHAKNTPW